MQVGAPREIYERPGTGGVVDCRIRVRDLVLRAHAHPSQVFRPGDRVDLQFNPERLIAVRSQDGALA